MDGERASVTDRRLAFEHLEPRLLLDGVIQGQPWDDPDAIGVFGAGEAGLSGPQIESVQFAQAGTSLSDAPGFVAVDPLPAPDARGYIIAGYGPSPSQWRPTQTTNINAADTTNADQLWSGGGLGLDLTGAGYTVGVWDAGAILDTHQEFGDRVTVQDGADPHDHSTHVGGTIGAQGVVASARGMANQVELWSYDWSSAFTEMDTAADTIIVSNHSYGFTTGWRYGTLDGPNGEKDYGIWYGDRDLGDEDASFGKYASTAQALDQTIHDNPYLLSVWSAGNERNDNYAYLDSYYYTYFTDSSSWQFIPVGDATYPAPPTDGNHDGGYDCLSEKKTAKNTLVVGAISDITADPYNNSHVTMSSFSSWGPTDDGRVKPDVVGNGVSLNSPVDTGNADYGSKSGTSMSSPNVAGTAALLIEHYEDVYGVRPLAATTKGVIIHTAFDAGNVGPDYVYGWGVADGAAAAGFITATAGGIGVLSENAYSGSQWTTTVQAGGTEPIKATIVWTDPPPATLPGAGLDDDTPVLVNDLDLWVTGPGGTYYPWTLDPANPADPAVRTGANHVDNVEQVLIDAPDAGAYTIHVGHTGDAFTQDFSFMATGVENSVPGVDLRGTAFQTDRPNLATSGGEARIDFAVLNGGDADAGAFDVQFYLSDDADIDPATDILLNLAASDPNYDSGEPKAYHISGLVSLATHAGTGRPVRDGRRVLRRHVRRREPGPGRGGRDQQSQPGPGPGPGRRGLPDPRRLPVRRGLGKRDVRRILGGHRGRGGTDSGHLGQRALPGQLSRHAG